MKRNTRLLAILIATILVLTATSYANGYVQDELTEISQATYATWSNRYNTILEMQADSDIIVKGTLVSSTPEQRNDLVFTRSTLNVTEVLKGSSFIENIEVLQTGGSLNGVVTSPICGAPLLESSKEYVLYLQHVNDPQYGEYYLISGGDQGLFVLSANNTLTTYAAGDRSLLQADTANTSLSLSNGNTPFEKYYWSHNPKVYLANAITNDYGAAVMAKIVSAMYSWNGIGNKSFVREFNITNADVLIFMNNYGVTGWDGISNRSCDSDRYLTLVQISLNNRGQAGSDLTFWQAVSCHELGHAIGLGHNFNLSIPSIMYENTSSYYPTPGYYVPQPADIATVADWFN